MKGALAPARRLGGLASLALALCTCADGGGRPEVRGEIAGDLDLEIRASAAIALRWEGDRLDAAIVPSAGYGLLRAGVELLGVGRRETLPEATAVLFTARFEGPAVRAGPCGAVPVSLALSLMQRDGSPRLAGGLAAYCGAGAADRPASPVRILRLSGSLR